MNLGVTCPGWSSVASCTRWCDGWQVVLKKQEMNIAERCQQYRTRLDFSAKALSVCEGLLDEIHATLRKERSDRMPYSISHTA